MAKATKPKTPKKPKAAAKPKAKTEKKIAAKKTATTIPVDRDMQALARHHRDKYIILKEAQNKANRAMQGLGKVIKGDGLAMSQIKTMVALMTPEGEAALRATIAADLMAAKWQGTAIGEQLSLFLEPDRTPSVDMAYEEGVQDSMDGKTANPKYDPSVRQHARYMEGYHDETKRRLEGGIKKTDDEPSTASKLITKAAKAETAKAAIKAAADRAEGMKPVPAAPRSGEGITRSEFKARQSAARDAAEKVFAKPAAGNA